MGTLGKGLSEYLTWLSSLPGNHGGLEAWWACCGHSPQDPPEAGLFLVLYYFCVTGSSLMLLHGPRMDGHRKAYVVLWVHPAPSVPESPGRRAPYCSRPCLAYLLPSRAQAEAGQGSSALLLFLPAAGEQAQEEPILPVSWCWKR